MEPAMRDGVREQFQLIREWTLMICVLGSVPWGGRCLVALCFGVPTKRSWCLFMPENHPPVVPVWVLEPGDTPAFLAWLIPVESFLNVLVLPLQIALCGLFLAGSYCWILGWAYGDTLEFLLAFIWAAFWLVGGVWTEAGQCYGERSAFSAPVRGVVHQPYQSSNFIVVALGGGYWLIHVHREGWSGCLWVVNDFGICCLLLKYTEPTGPPIRN